MEKNKIVATIAILVILLASVALLTPSVSAAPQHQIILPFYTGWENVDPLGRINSVDSKKDFYGYYGPDDPLVPELGWRDNEVSPPSDVFGYEFGSRQLMGAGYFGSSYSYCYFNLFDMTADSDWGPPFKIKPHTFINIWYYHMKLADCMIDAQLYNKRTQQYWTLRDFNYGGEYIVDQNGVRIHPAYRYNDPVGSWQFACFDLSIIYESDPENWYVAKIWIGFDNGNDHATGQARTYFDNLHLSYGVGGKEIHTDWDWADGDNAWTSGSLVAWDYHHRADGYYDLWLKVLISGFDDGYWVDPLYNTHEDLYPYKLKVSAGIDAQALIDPKPTGVNLTKPDPDWLKPKVYQFVYDSAVTIIGFVPYGWTVKALDLARKFYGLLQPPEAQPTYQWPDVDWGTANGDPKNRAEGEVYILIPGLSSGSHTIPITFSVSYYKQEYLGGYEYTPVYVNTVSLTLNLEWSTTPDYVNLPPETPSKPSGPTSGYTGTSYTYSTSTTDPNGDDVRYQFDWGDGSTTTTGWYTSGSTASASHSWGSSGTYYVKVRAQDSYEAWSGWSSSLTVSIAPYGGGCPYVSVWDGSQYALDNNLLGDSEASGGADVEDYYRLEQPLAPKDGKYSLLIREFEQEHSYLDQVRLLAVDHESNVYVAVSPSGEILTYKVPNAPVSATDNHGNSQLDLVGAVDGEYYKGQPSDYLILDFGNLDIRDGAKLVFRADIEIKPVKKCIHVQVLDATGSWMDVATVRTRVYWATEIVDLSDYLHANGELKVRLYFTGVHLIDYVGLDTTKQDDFDVHYANLVSAVHSEEGSVKTELSESDGVYAELVPGQQIELEFTLPENQKDARTYIIYVKGHYYTIS